MILGPEFQAASETLKGSGIGPTEVTSHVSNLIRGSRSALRRFTFGGRRRVGADAHPAGESDSPGV